MFDLDRLESEWLNQDSLVTLKARVLHLKASESYAETLAAWQVQEGRGAQSPRDVARLLRLLDERTGPVSELASSLGTEMTGGHVFRFLDRAGIDFRIPLPGAAHV